MKSLLFVAAIVAAATAMSVKMAPFYAKDSKTAAPGYIVMFRKDITDGEVRKHHDVLAQHMESYKNEEENQVTAKWTHLKGYAAKMNDELRDKVRLMPEVKYVERNQIVTISCESTDTVSWGVERTTIEGRVGPQPYSYLNSDQCDGRGVMVYVIDTGVDHTHSAFGGRALEGVSFVSGEGPIDLNGHGTHVAGTTISVRYGLAHGAQVKGVKVLNQYGSGSYDDVLSGINYVTGEKRSAPSVPAVINMSLGGGFSQAINDAITTSAEAGVQVVVAAGNDNRDACSYSPASAPNATTVGASDISDQAAYFTNYGGCVEIIGPGVDILGPLPNEGEASYSGTSMASPHVAGVMARYLTNVGCRPGSDGSDDPQSIEDYVVGIATDGAINGLPADTPNKLIHMSCDL